MTNLRSYPHAPDGTVVRRQYEKIPKRTFSVSTASPEWLATRSGLGFRLNAASLLDLARISYALEQPDAEVIHYLRESSDSFARVVTDGAEFHLDDHFDQLEVVVVLGAQERAVALSNLPPERHIAEGVTHPDAAEREFEILSDLAAGREAQAAVRMPNAVATLESAGLSKKLYEDIGSALDVQAQILTRNQEGLVRGLRRRDAAWAAKFSSPDIASSARGLMDLNGLALCALARRAGLTPWDGSVYMPLSLLQG